MKTPCGHKIATLIYLAILQKKAVALPTLDTILNIQDCSNIRTCQNHMHNGQPAGFGVTATHLMGRIDAKCTVHRS